MKTGFTRVVVSVLSLVTLIAVFLPGRIAFATETITIAFWEEPSESLLFTWGELIYTEAFRRLGLKFQYKVYPPARSSLMADSGQIDGEPSRIMAYQEAHPNLVRVDEWVVTTKASAYAMDPNITLDGWESLRGTDYRVEYYRGVAIAERHLPEVVKAENLSTISSPEQALNKLIAGRIDVYIDTEDRVALLLKSPAFKDSGIRRAGVMEEILSYPYLHKRHAALAPKLAEALKQMKAEGLFEQYMQQAQQKFMQK